MKVESEREYIFDFHLSTFLSCCVERITFGYLFESKYACLVQFYIHFFAIGKVHDNFVVTCELQQFGRFAVCFYAPALVCFIENQIDRFFFSFFFLLFCMVSFPSSLFHHKSQLLIYSFSKLESCYLKFRHVLLFRI